MNIIVYYFFICLVFGDTPYTLICQKEKPKGTLPNICLKYCQIAEQGCHPSLWKWTQQNGCTEEQEAKYIELRKVTLQVCQDILENCVIENEEDPETTIELSSTCSTFCYKVINEPEKINSDYISERYESLLQACKNTQSPTGPPVINPHQYADPPLQKETDPDPVINPNQEADNPPQDPERDPHTVTDPPDENSPPEKDTSPSSTTLNHLVEHTMKNGIFRDIIYIIFFHILVKHGD